ncbi:MAG: citrate synthase family protein [Chloroflexota bacterium]
MSEKEFFSAKEAASELGISLPTLYAYVSRGLLRSEATNGKSRARRYHAADIANLKQKQTYRKHPDQIASDTLQHGMPILESAITLIEKGSLFYRGHNALELATTHSFEEICILLWNGELDSTSDLFSSTQFPDISLVTSETVASPIEQFQMWLPLAASRDLGAYDFSDAGIQRTAARILKLMTSIVIGQPPAAGQPLAQALQTSWIPDHPDRQAAIEAALILSADHELNVSAFTARCIASAGSTLYQVIQGGLAALQGFRHGGHSQRVAALFDEVAEDIPTKVASFIRRGENLPGFDHPLYPNGDPRAVKLIELAEAHALSNRSLAIAYEVKQVVFDAQQRHPNFDFGLVTLCRSLELPQHAPIVLFALGRTAGWVAHALEQINTNQLIRPRARYVGKKND